jgi:D-glycero-D-manno-heptose 1,7-bisphosphate phosphatase
MQLVILDRDGVINQDTGSGVHSAAQWTPLPGSIAAIARLYKAGFTVVVATNQSGLARGYFDLDELEAIHAKLTQLVEAEGAELGAIFYCPHGPDDHCKCRKPQTGLIDAIEAVFNTSAEGAVLVGDSLRDLQAGQSKGCRLVLVETGNGSATRAQLEHASGAQPQLAGQEVSLAADLAAAAELIIQQDL